MRKVKLTVLSLLALTTMSLASCTGPQGEKGDKGDQGEQGIQGEPGEPGKPGEDGSLWYSGEGAPSSDLGKEGDMYLDTSTSDVYQKGADGWTKIANIKGDDGEDGEDGKNGSNGANGKTAWSNTILPSEGGYVTPSVGSALVGEAVTFTITPLENYVLTSLFLNNEEVTPTLSEDKTSYTYETTMVEHGFVVAASFDVATTKSGYVDGIKYNNVVKDAYGNVISYSGKVDNATEFAGGSGSVEDPLQISDAEMFTSENLNETGESNFILNNDITLTTSLPLVTKEGDDGVKETNLDLGGHSLTTKGSTVQLNNKDVLNIENGTLNIPTVGVNGAIAANEGSSISLDNVILNAGSGIGIWDSAISVNVTDTTINADIFGISTNASNWEDAKDIEINITGSTISTLNDTSGDNTAVLININADVNIENSTLEGARQALVVRSGNVNVENSTIKYNTRFSVDGSDPVGEYDGDYYGDHAWGQGNRVATAGIVVGDYQNSAYECPCNLNLTDVKFVEETYTPSGASTFADFDTPNKEKLYQLYINGEKESTPATVKMDSFTYSYFDEDRIFINQFGSLIVDGVNERVVGDNVFINGTLYDHATYKDNNGVYELINDPANKVSELNIKFSDGSGTETDPLQISNVSQFETLLRNKDVRLGGYSFLITADIDFNKASGEYFFPHFSGKISGEVDTEGKPLHTVTLVDTALTSGYLFGDTWGDVAIENLNIETTNVGLIAYSGWENGDKTNERVNYKLTMKNLIFEGVVNEDLKREPNNFGVVIGQSCAHTTTIEKVINNVDYTFNNASYNGAIFGGYFRTYTDDDPTNKAQVTIKDCEYGGTLTAGYAGFLFGNSANFNPTYADYNFSGNKLTGKLNGTIKSNILFGKGGNNSYTLQPDDVTYNKENLSESLAKNITVSDRVLTLTGELEDKELKYDLTYIHYSKGYKNSVESGTQLLTHYVGKADVSKNLITVPEKYFVYNEFNGTDDKYVKFTEEKLKLEDLEWTLYLNDINDDKLTYEPRESEECIITIYEGVTVVGVYVL